MNNIEPGKTRWYIDIDWYDMNNRSFLAMSRGYLCQKCRKKLKVDDKEVAANTILSALKGCCSKSTDFIRYGLPVTESVFRILLGNGNKPLEVEEIAKRLGQGTGLGTPNVSVQTLYRILSNDRYYGIRQARD